MSLVDDTTHMQINVRKHGGQLRDVGLVHKDHMKHGHEYWDIVSHHLEHNRPHHHVASHVDEGRVGGGIADFFSKNQFPLKTQTSYNPIANNYGHGFGSGPFSTIYK